MADGGPGPATARREGGVGLIGLGRLGGLLAQRLLEAGRRLVVLDRDPVRVRPWLEQGAGEAATAFYLTSAVESVLLALPDSRAVESALEGPEGVLAALAPGQLVVDLGASLPSSHRRLAALAATRGAQMLDASVVRRGTQFSILVGGSPAGFQQAEPLLTLLAPRLGYVGPPGSGHLAKLAGRIVQAAHSAALAEGLAFARGAGLDPAQIADLLELGGAPAMLERRFGDNGELRLHTKDLGYALEVAQEVGLPAPVTAITNEIFKSVSARGDPSWDEAAVITFWEVAAPDEPAAAD